MTKFPFIKIFTLLVVLTLGLNRHGFAQSEFYDNGQPTVDSATSMVFLGANFSTLFPFGMMRDTFKMNLNFGAILMVKTKSNWTIDLNFNYYFASSIRNPNGILRNLVDEHGSVIDGVGLESTIYMEGRFWHIGAGIGKIIPLDNWKNSGLWLRFDVGYFEHKIRIKEASDGVPQILDDYLKGYDQKSGGFAMSQFFGYLFMRRHRVGNFYVGIECYEMWTKPLRNYIFNVGPTKDIKYAFSGMVGAKIGWFIPLYEKKRVTNLYRF
ncbi:MAG: hypothetical protein LBV46_02345 [Bacteroidales bacterium]|jgi:hypothetical protein|nr:hypothetical protein [Bacteroidales bacterium]